jgi:1-pyrroline-5-carboxylate dehydrogenase
MSHGTRFPYGAVSVICPFNFPLEIPALQAFGALMVGNHVTLKADQRVAVVMEQFLKMCIDKVLSLPLGHGPQCHRLDRV